MAERFHRTVEMLEIAPSDRLLEIGCGHGGAISLICPKLSSGAIVGIDRSSAMIAQASRRNRQCVAAGRARFEAVALEDANFDRRFDKVFAINMRLFGTKAAHEADVLRRLLTPEGALFLFQQHPSAGRTRAVTDELTTALLPNGFSLRDVTSEGEGASLMTCIVAEPHGCR